MLPKACKQFLLAAGFLFFLLACQEVYAVLDIVSFNVDSSFESSGKSQLSAVLVKTSPKLNIYIERTWWEAQSADSKAKILQSLDALSQEFESNIHPVLTSVFGPEWNPGVDGDSKITILFHSMHSNEGGYFRTTDEYVKLQLPESNEKEMVFLSLDLVNDPRAKIVLAHEFVHMITFNQKNIKFGVEEDTWLNEARADYSSTILGYDNKYQGSNLQQRVRDFVESPSDSVTEWRGKKYDYASAGMFMHYFIDHYGINILIDSLKSKHIGIESLDYALKKNGYKEVFGDVFTNWTIASVLNNCSASQKYCFLNENLKNFKLSPALNFLPVTGNVSLSVNNSSKRWTGNWLKFIGGNGDLKLTFSSLKGLKFQVPYIVEDSSGIYAVKFLDLDANQQGEIDISKFGADYKSLVIIPSLQSQIYQSEIEPTYPFTYKVEIKASSVSNDQDIVNQLLGRIAELKQEIAKLQSGKTPALCSSIEQNLSLGSKNTSQVKCLQQFLKLQGSEIYPEGLVTGNFGSLTRLAVKKFQEKFLSDILAPLGLKQGTGFVGPSTREKINRLLNGI